MARGTGHFDADVLKKLRKTKPVEGELLSASKLAELVGTSKSRILAYENGTSVPDPNRVFELAAVFGVPTRELYRPIKGPVSLRDMRAFAGYTAAEVAAFVGVSRATYRDLEQWAIVPPRHAGIVLGRLSQVLDLPSRMIEKALEVHPAARQRRAVMRGLLGDLFDRAHVRDVPAAVSPEESKLVALAELLRRPPSVVCRLVNNEMNRLRRMLLSHAMQSQAVAYAQTPKTRRQAEAEMERIGDAIARFPTTAALTLDRFTAWALTSHEWRVVAQLSETTYIHVGGESEGKDGHLSVWYGLTARGFVVPDRDRAGASRAYVLTVKGIREVRTNIDRYGCLYPRIAAPRVRADVIRATPRRSEAPLRG